MVGVRGFEPLTLCSQSRCATRLRHTPICRAYTGKAGIRKHIACRMLKDAFSGGKAGLDWPKIVGVQASHPPHPNTRKTQAPSRSHGRFELDFRTGPNPCL